MGNVNVTDYAVAEILEEPSQSNHARDRIQTQVGTVHAAAGEVEITGFRGDREVATDKVMRAHRALQVKLKRAA